MHLAGVHVVTVACSAEQTVCELRFDFHRLTHVGTPLLETHHSFTPHFIILRVSDKTLNLVSLNYDYDQVKPLAFHLLTGGRQDCPLQHPTFTLGCLPCGSGPLKISEG